MALGVGPGDEVVTTPLSFFATAGAIARLGARPVFADIDPRHAQPRPGAARWRASRRARRAIMPVHLFGRAADARAARRHRRADHRGRRAGDRRAGRSAAGTLRDAELLPVEEPGRRRRRRRGDHRRRRARRPAAPAARARLRGPSTCHHVVGGNFRLDALQAAILRAKLPHLRRVERGAAARNADALPRAASPAHAARPARATRPATSGTTSSCAPRAATRCARTWPSASIETEIYYPLPLHLQPCFADLGYGAGDLPAGRGRLRRGARPAGPPRPHATRSSEHVVAQRSRSSTG